MNNSENENISFSDQKTEEKFYEKVDGYLSVFVDKMRYIDFISEENFSNRNGYTTFMKIINALKNNGLISEKAFYELNGTYRVLSYVNNNPENVKKLVNEYKDILNDIEDVGISFIGYDIPSILNCISFRKHPLNQNYYLVTPEKAERKINPNKVEAFMSNPEDMKNVGRMVRTIFSILGIKFPPDFERKGLINSGDGKLLFNKLNNAMPYVPFEIKEFFKVLKIKVDVKVDDYRELAKYKNGIFIDDNVFCINEKIVEDCVSEINRIGTTKVKIKDIIDYLYTLYPEKRIVKIKEIELDEEKYYVGVILLFNRWKIETFTKNIFGFDYLESLVDEIEKKYPFITREKRGFEVVNDDVWW